MARFRPGFKMTAFVLIFVPATLALGLWQTARGDYKRDLHDQYLDALTQLPQRYMGQASPNNFARLRVDGVYTHEQFFVDNQVHEGRVGYWLLQAVDLVDQTEQAGSYKKVLVNRGFYPAPQSRAQLPNLTTPALRQSLVGVVWPFTGLIPLLADDAWSADWPKRVQRLDIARMAELVGALPVEIRLESDVPGVAVAAPVAPRLDEDKHRGYAATWFGLTVALVVLYLLYGFRNSEDTRT